MNGDRLLDQLLVDLKKIHQVCTEENLELVPSAGVTYVAANRRLITYFISGVFAQQTSTDRTDLANKHAWLDRTVAIEGFQELATYALEEASDTSRDSRSFVFNEDSLHMLLRVLEYAPFCQWDTSGYQLQYTPIERFGLRRRFGNFEELTAEEYAQIPWKLSEIIYTEHKVSVFQECRRWGFDLEISEQSFYRTDYRTHFASALATLAELLQCKVECDVAAVILGTPARVKHFETPGIRIY